MCENMDILGGLYDIYICDILTLYGHSWLVYKYSSLLIIILYYVYLITIQVHTNVIDIFISILGYKYSGTVFSQTISDVS